MKNIILTGWPSSKKKAKTDERNYVWWSNKNLSRIRTHGEIYTPLCIAQDDVDV